jgi:hypothetical protein
MAKTIIGLLLLAVSVRSFQISSHRIIGLRVKVNVGGARSQGLLSLRSSANASRRAAVGTLLAVGAEAFGLRKSFAAALSGADPEDKNKLLKAIQVISDFETQYKDPSQWSGIIEKLSQVSKLTPPGINSSYLSHHKSNILTC